MIVDSGGQRKHRCQAGSPPPLLFTTIGGTGHGPYPLLSALPELSIFFLFAAHAQAATLWNRTPFGGSTSIYWLYGLNDASLFGMLKPELCKKRTKNALNPLILFVDSTFHLIYSHRYIEQKHDNNQATSRIFSKKGGGETS